MHGGWHELCNALGSAKSEPPTLPDSGLAMLCGSEEGKSAAAALLEALGTGIGKAFNASSGRTEEGMDAATADKADSSRSTFLPVGIACAPSWAGWAPMAGCTTWLITSSFASEFVIIGGCSGKASCC